MGRIRGKAGGAATGKMQQRRLLERLELLCCSGAGMEAIAPSLCTVFRDLAEADSGSIFWVDSNGQPTGFYHDCATAELKDYFVTNFDTLFSAIDEINMMSMLLPTPPNIGKALDPDFHQRFTKSNVYKYLCLPLEHEFLLDLRVDIEGRGRALLCGWSKKNNPPSPAAAKRVEPVQHWLQQALLQSYRHVNWKSVGSRTAHFITDAKGELLISIDNEAELFLQAGHLLRQNIPMKAEMRDAPSFARQLASMLDETASAEIAVPAASGRLVMRAVKSNMRNADGSRVNQMMVSVDLQRAVEVIAIDYLCDQPMTMLQKQIALFAIQGGARRDCDLQFDVSAEALKKHLRAIYNTLEVENWSELAAFFERNAAAVAN